MARRVLDLTIVKAACNSKAIAWVQIGGDSLVPHTCDIQFGSGKTYLAIKLPDRRNRYRLEIDPRLLLRLLPDQWEGVDYLYQPPVRVPARRQA